MHILEQSAAREGHAGVRGSKARGLGSRTMEQSNSQQQIQPLLLQIADSTHFSAVFSNVSWSSAVTSVPYAQTESTQVEQHLPLLYYTASFC